MTVVQQFKHSQLARILFIGFLVLLLQIPTVMLQNLIQDRQSIRQEAVTGITQSWGRGQMVIGPRLAVPYAKRVIVDNKERVQYSYGVFLPESLKITGDLKTEVRKRGIFEVPVYIANLKITGQFSRPDFSSWGVRPEDINWNAAELNLQISDAHAIQNQAVLQWNQKDVPFAAGLGKFAEGEIGIHASLKGQPQADSYTFSIPLELKGSEKIGFAPFGRVSEVTLTSDWNNPSFQGVWPPKQHEVRNQGPKKGFDATWSIPSLGRNYPQQWNRDNAVSSSKINESLIQIDLISPVDNYRMADRSVRYNFLFLLLTFVVFWLFETATKLSVHPLQYLLVGVAMSMFYMLQLAISERLSFGLAYLISSIAVVGLLTAYSVAVLRAKKRGAIIGVMQVGLYSYLYTVLASQDDSLLLGSLGLFIFLAIMMYFTRNMDWLSGPRSQVVPAGGPTVPPTSPPRTAFPTDEAEADRLE
jgi:inner membrane protein